MHIILKITTQTYLRSQPPIMTYIHQKCPAEQLSSRPKEAEPIPRRMQASQTPWMGGGTGLTYIHCECWSPMNPTCKSSPKYLPRYATNRTPGNQKTLQKSKSWYHDMMPYGDLIMMVVAKGKGMKGWASHSRAGKEGVHDWTQPPAHAPHHESM